MFIQLPFLTILARKVLEKKVIKSGFKILIKKSSISKKIIRTFDYKKNVKILRFNFLIVF